MMRRLPLNELLCLRSVSFVFLCIPVLLLSSPVLVAQANEWAWMGGNSTFAGTFNGETGSPGVYGTLSQGAQTNIPGGRLGAVSWVASVVAVLMM